MKHLMIILLLVEGLSCFSQKTTNDFPQKKQAGTILEIHPNGAGFTIERLRYNSTVKFRITNVNPFKLEGTNSVSKQSVSFEVPAQFSQLPAAAGKEEMAAISKGKDLMEEMQQIENSYQKIIEKSDGNQGSVSSGFLGDGIINKKKLTETHEKQLAPLRKQYDILLLLKQQQEATSALKNTFMNSYDGFVKELYTLALYTSVPRYIDSLLQDTFIVDTATLKANLDSYMLSINDGDRDINQLRNKPRKAFAKIDSLYLEAKGAYDLLAKEVKNETVNLSGTLSDEDKTIKLMVDNFNLTLVKDKIFEKECAFLQTTYDSLRSSTRRTAIINNVQSGVDYYHTVLNARFEVYTDAQQLNEDKVTITPKLKNKKGEIIKEYAPVEIKTFGGWKVDFSTGYLLSFRGDENYTHLYDSSGVTGVQKNKADNLKHAIGAFFNAYPRTGRDINVGFSFGISLPTDGTGVGFYGGVSALMLEKNRLVISLGIAENKINELNVGNLKRDFFAEKISGKETYQFSNKDYREIKYNYVYRPSVFIGISYNIFPVKK